MLNQRPVKHNLTINILLKRNTAYIIILEKFIIEFKYSDWKFKHVKISKYITVIKW